MDVSNAKRAAASTANDPLEMDLAGNRIDHLDTTSARSAQELSALLFYRSHGRYDMVFAGERVVVASRDAECDLARVLFARAFTGAVRILDGRNGRHRSTLRDIERLAALTCKEGRQGPRHVKRAERSANRAPAGEAEIGRAP